MQVATDKTEIILITGMRIPKIINVNIANNFFITSEAINTYVSQPIVEGII